MYYLCAFIGVLFWPVALPQEEAGKADSIQEKVDAIEQDLRDFRARLDRKQEGSLRKLLDAYYSARKKIRDLMSPTMTRKDLKGISLAVRELRKEEYDLSVAHWHQTLEKTPWSDLLAKDDSELWKASRSVEFSLVNSGEDMILHLNSTAEFGDRVRGNLIRKANPGWIDFALEMDVTIEKAGFVFLGRCMDPQGRYMDPTRFFQLSFETGGKGNPLVAGQRYRIELKVIGDRAEMTVKVQKSGKWEDVKLAVPKLKLPAVARAGSVGFGLNPGAKVQIHELKAKVVRRAP